MRSLNCRRWALVLIYLRPKKNFYRRCLIALYVQVSVQSPKEIKASRDVFLCRKCLHQWMFGLGVAMIFGPRVTCKVSSTSPSQWNPRCMSSWLIISTLRLWLRPSGGWFEDNVSIKTATLPRFLYLPLFESCQISKNVSCNSVWEGFSSNFEHKRNTIFNSYVQWFNHQDPRRSHWLCHLDPGGNGLRRL